MLLHIRLFFCCALLSFMSPAAYAETFRAQDSSFIIDLPAGWQTQNTAGENGLLFKAERGGRDIAVSTLEQELSEKYSRARLMDAMDALRGHGYSMGGGINELTAPGRSCYFFTYSGKGVTARQALLTFAGNTYNLTAVGLTAEEFFTAVNSIRKDGTPVVAFPVRARPLRRAPPPPDANAPVLSLDGDAMPSQEQAPAGQPMASSPTETEPILALGASATDTAALYTEAVQQQQQISTETAVQQQTQATQQAFKRQPMPLLLWVVLAVLWFAGGRIAKQKGKAITNPVLPPPPKELPPDFFFPFSIKHKETPAVITYTMISRQGIKLTGRYDRFGEWLMVAGFYGLIAMHVLWSLLALVKISVPHIIASLIPLGSVMEMAPELPFVLLFVLGILARMKVKKHLSIYDDKQDLLVEAMPFGRDTILKDGKGKEVGRVKRKTGALVWTFMDQDDHPAFTIVNDHPNLASSARIFGNQGGLLCPRYSLMVGNQRAGFVLENPQSPRNYQILLDYNFSRIAKPSQILAALLYVRVTNSNRRYPWLW